MEIFAIVGVILVMAFIIWSACRLPAEPWTGKSFEGNRSNALTRVTMTIILGATFLFFLTSPLLHKIL